MGEKKVRPVAVDGKVIGKFVIADRTFHKKASRRKHFMWSIKSWGLQRSAFIFLENQGCTNIIIHDKDSNTTVWASVQEWKEHGVVKDYGHGAQVFLHESRFHVNDEDQVAMEGI